MFKLQIWESQYIIEPAIVYDILNQQQGAIQLRWKTVKREIM